MATLTIKKYSNRRLYDTDQSRYITLEELAERVRRGADVRVVDAKSNEDLTQATLVQIVLETRATRLLPVPLLARLIRMQDDALGEFFSKYVSTALEMYLAAKQGAQAVSPYFPLANLPFAAAGGLARVLGGLPVWGDGQGAYGPPQGYPYGQQPVPYPQAAPPPPSPPPPPPSGASEQDVAALRSELEAIKREILAKKPRRAKAR